MSIRPSGVESASRPCSRSASQAPPVYSPIMALFGPRRGRSSATSCRQSFSASGSGVTHLSKILLQDELCGHRIDALALRAAQTTLRFHRTEALIDALYREMKSALELPREALDPLGERVFALLGDRQADHELRGLPFLYQASDGLEARRGDRCQRMRRAELGLPDCYSNTL